MKPKVAPQQFRVLKPRKPLIFHAEGTLYGSTEPGSITTTPRNHTLRISRIRSRADISENLPIGREATATFIGFERRQEEKEHWKRFLGWNPDENKRFLWTLTHTLTWGYWLSDGSYAQILRSSFNFSVNGYPTDGAAQICGEFLIEQALWLPTAINGEGRLIQHAKLTSLKPENRLFWLVMLFTQYLWLARGDFPRH